MLNKEQSNFVKKMNENIKFNRYGLYLLEAPAGCGKTFCCSFLIKHNSNQSYIIAPTHKAKQILGKTNENCNTIHRFLRGKMTYDEFGNQKYIFHPEELEDCIIFIDECSMINDEVFDILKNNYEKNNYLIFCGDPLQLPPINNEDNDDLKYNSKMRKSKSFDIKNKFELIENMRAKENPLGVCLINKARDSIKNKILPDFVAKCDIKAMLDFIYKKKQDFIVLAYSNVRVNFFNKIIRKKLFEIDEDDKLEDYYVNEKLIFSGYRWERDITYYTSDLITIKKLEIENKDIYYKVCKCNKILKKCIKCGIANHKTPYKNITFWKITDEYSNIWYKPKKSEDKKKFHDLETHYRNHCKTIKKSFDWVGYYSFVNFYDADLRYNYSTTIHKSQGDEWKYVFVDRNNLIQCAKETFLRLTSYYTAISRMKNKVMDVL